MDEQKKVTAVSTQQNAAGGVVSPFSNLDNFTAAQRMCSALSRSTMVPDDFRTRPNDGGTGIANTLVAFQLASRLNVDIFMVMQNVYAIHGRPSFSTAFIIATVNTCGRFTPIRYEYTRDGNGNAIACRAFAEDKRTGVRLDGTTVTMEMARAEGWSTKSGSKWKTMPEQMLAYRAATFWARLHAPDVILGMHTVEEEEDIGALPTNQTVANLNAAVKEETPAVEATIVEEPKEKPKASGNIPVEALNQMFEDETKEKSA